MRVPQISVFALLSTALLPRSRHMGRSQTSRGWRWDKIRDVRDDTTTRADMMINRADAARVRLPLDSP